MEPRTQYEILINGLKSRRHQLGWTQEFMRDVHKIDVSKVECGDSLPNLNTFISLCECYKMCPGLVLILWRMTINGKLAKPDFIFITTHWDEVAIPLTKLLETITKKLVEQPLDKDITHEMNILI